MYPVICTLGPVRIFSYGLMLAVAVLLCTFLAGRDARSKGIASQVIYDFAFWVVLGGILGARIFFIILNGDYFFQHPWETVMISKGGLAWQGGLLFGAVSGIVFIRRRQLPLFVIFDLVAPYAALGQAIGRAGCFFNGCCYGRPVSWGIYFPVHQARLHPAQLYDAAGLFFIFLFLKCLQYKNRRPGVVFVLYLAMAGALRFFVEFYRADHTSEYFGLSVFQYVCLVIMGTAGCVYAHLCRSSGQ
jgi:phosphatidylglycerol---prolipoprotein diacylglyceryl transferase